MRGGALPPALLFAALGLALAFAPRRHIGLCLGILVVVSLGASFAPLGAGWRDTIFLGCWASLVVIALTVHLPKGLGLRVALVLTIDAGLWGGGVIALAGDRIDLMKALPAALVCIPGRWLVTTRRQIVIKVLSSWLLAVAVLAATLQITTPTPGYVADHMD